MDQFLFTRAEIIIAIEVVPVLGDLSDGTFRGCSSWQIGHNRPETIHNSHSRFEERED